jgi:hypothetical protein
MKKLLTLVFCALLGGVVWAASPGNTQANPFQDDLSRLDNEFAGISQLEQLVEERNATYSELAAENNVLLQNVNSDTDIAASLLNAMAPDDERLLNIPGFWWGFCLGILGVILVYVAIDGETKQREGKKAMVGCLIRSALYGFLYILALVLEIVYEG